MEVVIKTISLFSGAGGLDVGARNAGLEVVFANDLNKHACATYSANIGEHIECGPLDEKISIIESVGPVDFVIGGPPCQGFSVAGKMSPSDPRSRLVFEFMRVVELSKPQVFIMENVKGLGALAKFADVRNELFKEASRMGYRTCLTIQNSKNHLCPTSRERMFFVGFRTGNPSAFLHFIEKMKVPEIPVRTVFDSLGPAGSDKNPITCKAEVTLAANPILRRSPYAGMLFNGLGRPVNPEKPCATLPASMGGNKTPIVDENQIWGDGSSWVEDYHAHLMDEGEPYDWKSAPKFLRRLTINEAHLIQTFPSNFEFKGPNSAIYSQIGNCVPCNLGEAVVTAAIKALNTNESTNFQQGQLSLPV